LILLYLVLSVLLVCSNELDDLVFILMIGD